jgi:tungstate transport system substrate-binding protein
MRRFFSPPGARRVLTLAFVAALVIALAVPANGFAAYSVSIKSNAAEKILSQTFLISGAVSPNAAGQTLTVQYRKKGLTSWKSVSRKLTTKSKWAYSFKPSSTGTWYLRAKFGGTTSKTLSVKVNPKLEVILQSTTSTQDSGLFTVLIPAFEKAYGIYKVKVVAVGSGQAITNGKNKDGDVCLVHSPAAEKAAMNARDGSGNPYFESRKKVMYNEFFLVGPVEDPGNIKPQDDIVASFNKIYTEGVKFVSRGDNSGTHSKEKSIWKLAGKTDYATKSWYQSAGAGMGETLQIAANVNGYTLVDSATWITNPHTGLAIMQENDPILYNPYSVMVVYGAHNIAGGRAFSNWITSDSGQTVIRNYKHDGKRLFIPNAD